MRGRLRGRALGVLCVLTAAGPALAADPILPIQGLTPGAVNAAVNLPELCGHDWARGEPPVRGGGDTYSRAARNTPRRLKDQAFAQYGIADPHDHGARYEVDHRVPLSLGGRDVLENLWPQTRDRAVPWNAWLKDRLELKLYRLVCHPAPGRPPLPVREAQAAFEGDWTQAFARYCPTEAECPGEGDD